MQSDRSQIEEIKSKIDIVSFIGETVHLTQEGDSWKGATSSSSKSGKSLTVNRDKQVYNNFPEQDGGDIYNWIAWKEGLDIETDFKDILTIAANKAGVALVHNDINPDDQPVLTMLRAAAEHYHSNLTSEHRTYIYEKWGITDKTIDDMLIGFAPKVNNLENELSDVFQNDDLKRSGLFYADGTILTDVFRGRIIFPYWRGNKVVYFIGRDPKWTEESTHGKYIKMPVHTEKRPYISEVIDNNVFYGEDTIKRSNECLITEGVTDCIMAIQSGIPCISPVTIRIKETEKKHALGLVENIKSVYICNDNEDNNAGFEGAVSTAEYLESNGVSVKLIELPRPDGVDKIDLAEYLTSNTSADFRQLPMQSVWVIKLDATTIPDNAMDKAKAVRDFIVHDLSTMDNTMREVFIKNDVRKHFDIGKADMNKVLKAAVSEIDKADETKNISNKIKSGYTTWHGINIPNGYKIQNNSICEVSHTENGDILRSFCNTPAIITKTGRNVDDNSYWNEITFDDQFGQEHKEWLCQRDTLSRNGIMTLANMGLVLTEKNASDMNEFISRCIHINKDILTKSLVVSTNGWKNDNAVFVCGENGYSENEICDVIHVHESTKNGLDATGDLECWKKTVAPFINDYTVRIKIYAAFTASILQPINLNSFILDHAGDSSTGKTFSCNIAMSCIGNYKTLQINGDTTKTALEAKCHIYNDLPISIDEYGTQINPDVIKTMVYMIANGQGRGRANIDATLRETKTWKTVALTTGEYTLTQDESLEGQQVRVIELKRSMPHMQDVDFDEVLSRLLKHNGHIAPLFFKTMLEEIDEIKELFVEVRKHFNEAKSKTGARLADTFAGITVAGILIESVFDSLGMKTLDPLDVTLAIFNESVIDTPIEAYHIRGLHIIMDFIKQKSSGFSHNGAKTKNRNEMYGWIQNDTIDVIPTVVKNALEKEGYNVSKVKQGWKDNKIIVHNKNRMDFVVRHENSSPVKVIRFDYDKVKEHISNV